MISDVYYIHSANVNKVGHRSDVNYIHSAHVNKVGHSDMNICLMQWSSVWVYVIHGSNKTEQKCSTNLQLQFHNSQWSFKIYINCLK